jgi:hypothetical protein
LFSLRTLDASLARKVSSGYAAAPLKKSEENLGAKLSA